jgi:hypothetical protein
VSTVTGSKTFLYVPEVTKPEVIDTSYGQFDSTENLVKFLWCNAPVTAPPEDAVAVLLSRFITYTIICAGLVIIFLIVYSAGYEQALLTSNKAQSIRHQHRTAKSLLNQKWKPNSSRSGEWARNSVSLILFDQGLSNSEDAMANALQARNANGRTRSEQIDDIRRDMQMNHTKLKSIDSMSKENKPTPQQQQRRVGLTREAHHGLWPGFVSRGEDDHVLAEEATEEMSRVEAERTAIASESIWDEIHTRARGDEDGVQLKRDALTT